MSSEERRILEDMSDHMATPYDDQDDDALLAAYRTSVRSAEVSNEQTRQILASFRKRHSWAKLVALTGDPQSTLYNRANPRRKPSDQPEGGSEAGEQ